MSDVLDLIDAEIIFKNTQTMILIKERLLQSKDFNFVCLHAPAAGLQSPGVMK